MKAHTKIYFNFFGIDYDPQSGWHDFIKCELCDAEAVDIHHIEARGMGGSKLKDVIINLMALCRSCHTEFGDLTHFKAFLSEEHRKVMTTHLKQNKIA